MNEESVAIDWLRAKAISYESSGEELHYALILYNLIMNLQRENQELKKQNQKQKEAIDKTLNIVEEQYSCTDDYYNEEYYWFCPEDYHKLIDILKEVE